MTVFSLFEGPLIGVAAALLALAVYQLSLVAAAAVPSPRRPLAAGGERRFAVLVPAHEEAAVIERLLESLARLRYPRRLFDVHVVADHCADSTAAVARRHTPFVHERRGDAARGKGQALRWLLERLPPGRYDAFAVIDADSVVLPDFLAVMNARLEEGDVAVQARYGVLNADGSWVASLRSLAFDLVNNVRRRGLSAIGASVGLAGNGMAFASSLLEARRWEAFGVTEDLELHAELVEAGVRVRFAPETAVLAEMPVSLRQARSQNLRWERGRLALLRAHLPRLIVSARRPPRRPKLIAAVELMTPPLSVQTLLVVAALGLALALGSGIALITAGAASLAIALYVCCGLLLAGAPLRLWLALPFAPAYVLWKGWLYAQALATRQLPWVKTTRL